MNRLFRRGIDAKPFCRHQYKHTDAHNNNNNNNNKNSKSSNNNNYNNNNNININDRIGQDR